MTFINNNLFFPTSLMPNTSSFPFSLVVRDFTICLILLKYHMTCSRMDCLVKKIFKSAPNFNKIYCFSLSQLWLNKSHLLIQIWLFLLSYLQCIFIYISETRMLLDVSNGAIADTIWLMPSLCLKNISLLFNFC